jgi:hypothetical protein
VWRPAGTATGILVDRDSDATLRKEAVWRLLRLAKVELDSGQLEMASRLLGDAADLLQQDCDVDVAASLADDNAAVSPALRKQ